MFGKNKKIKEFIIFALTTFFFGIIFAYASWYRPTQAPPDNGQIGAPITRSRLGQIKQGGLLLNQRNTNSNGLIVLGDRTHGLVGIGTTDPLEKLDVVGDFVINGLLKPDGISGNEGDILVRIANNKMKWDRKYQWLRLSSDTNSSVQTGTVTGFKWFDSDRDGIWDSGEPVMDGWNIILCCVNSQPITVTTGAPQTGSWAEGYFEFKNLPDGNYTICEQLQSGWSQHYPRSGPDCGNSLGYSVTIVNSTNIGGLNFGNYHATIQPRSRSRSGGSCGDGVLNQGEGCDPVGAWCYNRGVLSICDSTCRCVSRPQPPSFPRYRPPSQPDTVPPNTPPGSGPTTSTGEIGSNNSCDGSDSSLRNGYCTYLTSGCGPNETCKSDAGTCGCVSTPVGEIPGKTVAENLAENDKDEFSLTENILDSFAKNFQERTFLLSKVFAQSIPSCTGIPVPNDCSSVGGRWNNYNLVCAEVTPGFVTWIRNCYR